MTSYEKLYLHFQYARTVMSIKSEIKAISVFHKLEQVLKSTGLTLLHSLNEFKDYFDDTSTEDLICVLSKCTPALSTEINGNKLISHRNKDDTTGFIICEINSQSNSIY